MAKTKKHLVPATLREKGIRLKSYQQEGVKWLIKTPYGLLGDTPGLGKTPQAIVASNYFEPDRILVLAPSSMLGTWERELNTWLLPRNYGKSMPKDLPNIQKLTKGEHFTQTNIFTADIILTSYDLLYSKRPKVGRESKSSTKEAAFERAYLIADWLSESKNNLVVCDESLRVKSITAQRHRAIRKAIRPAASRLWLLNGTPIKREIDDLFGQLAILDPDKYSNLEKWQFRHMYPSPVPFGRGVEFKGCRDPKKLRDEIAPYVLRRLKSKVLQDLPPKNFINIFLEVSHTAAEISSRNDDVYKAILEERLSVTDPNYPQMRATFGLQKAPAMLNWLLEHLEDSPEDEPLVVFAHHKPVIEYLVNGLKKAKHSVCSITGATSSRDRTKVVEEFQAGKHRVFVGNILAAGEGITLTRACECVIAELDTSPSVIAQASDRVHRITQEKSVNIYFLIGAGTIEDRMIDMLQSRVRVIDKAVEHQV